MIAAFCFAVLHSVHAQGAPGAIGGIELTTSSDNPAPGQTVTITARSYTINIYSAKIVWTVDGKIVQSGVGMTTFDIKAPELGKKKNVVVTGVSVDGAYVGSSVSIESGSVDMIIESDGYTPPFFQGKLNPAYQNAVKIIAVPHIADSSGIEYDPKTLIYAWKKNDRVLESQSGYGKQSIVLVGDIVPRPYTLDVTVSSKTGAQAQGISIIGAQSPSIGFYADDPLYGALFNRGLKNSVYIGSQKEAVVLAVPFGFNKLKSGSNNLSFTWLINNSVHPELTSNESVILRSPEGLAGSSNIELSILNNQKILQGTRAGFSALFNVPSAKDKASVITF